MKKTILIGFVLTSILAISAVAQELPPDVAYEYPDGNVTFSHTAHAIPHPACTDCHPEPFGMAKTELGEEAGHAGCAKCHTADGGGSMDVASEEACVKCHIPAE